jgi:CIC family chloride channel protein
MTDDAPQSGDDEPGAPKTVLRAGPRQGWTWMTRAVHDAFADGRSVTLWLAAIAVGIAAGYGALGLRWAISGVQFITFGEAGEALATAARALPVWSIILAPVVGGAVVSALLWLGQRMAWLTETRAEGVADVMEARAVAGGQLKVMPGLLSAMIAAVSLGSGASAGREGPAVHLGATLASLITRPLGLPARAARIMLACGAAAAVSASFNAPVAGALFAFEVILGHYALRSIAPVAVSSVIGAILSRLHFGAQPAFPVPEIDPARLVDYAAMVPLGVAAAGLAIAFILAVTTVPRLVAERAKALQLPLWALPPLGGLLVGAIAVFAPEILGVGYEATATSLAGGYALATLAGLIILKLIATVITLSARFGGGVFSPSLYLGALLGALFGQLAILLFGDTETGAAFYAVVGMGAVSGAVLGAPLSTTLIVFELTASYEASIALLVAVSLATVITQSVTKGSVFHRQVERHGYDLTRGDARVILQTIRAREVMTPLSAEDAAAEMDAPGVFEDDYLGRVLGFFSAERLDGAPVRSRTGDQPIIGYITKADAHAAYAAALQARHEEEHG